MVMRHLNWSFVCVFVCIYVCLLPAPVQNRNVKKKTPVNSSMRATIAQSVHTLSDRLEGLEFEFA